MNRRIRHDAAQDRAPDHPSGDAEPPSPPANALGAASNGAIGNGLTSWSRSFGEQYAQLRAAAHRVCRSQRGMATLPPTALLHEVYLRLSRASPSINNDEHLTALCVRIMRQIIIDRARSQASRQASGSKAGMRARDLMSSRAPTPEQVLAIDEALTGLRTLDPRKADVFALRFFCAMTIDEVARVLSVARSTVAEDWRFARAWLAEHLRGTTR